MRGTNVSSIYVNTPDLMTLNSWGVKLLRYQINTLNNNDITVANYPTYVNNQIAKLDLICTAAKPFNIKIIPSLYPPPGGTIPNSSPRCHRIFKNKAAMDALVAAWDKIAAHYASSTIVIGYDLLGEPAFNLNYYNKACLKWPELAIKLGQTILKYNSSKSLIIEPVFGNGDKMGKLAKTVKGLPGAKVYLSPHYYRPPSYCGQGTDMSPKSVQSYPSYKCDKAFLVSAFAAGKQTAETLRCPVFVGEFSAVRWAPGSYQYLKDVMDLFESYGWGYTYQIFNEYQGWNPMMSDVKTDMNIYPTTKRLELLKTYWKKD